MSEDLKPSITAVYTAMGGDEPTRNTGWVKILCPLHEERNPSATINEDAGRINCFSCLDQPIDAYELVARKEGIDNFGRAKERAWELAAGVGGVTGQHTGDGPRLPRSGGRKERGGYRPSWRSGG